MMAAKTKPADDAAEEAAEKPMERKLTALGRATLAKMKKQYGEEEGEAKFAAACKSGTLSMSKMYVGGKM